MFWSLSFQLLPGEEILEDSAGREDGGIKPAYSIFLSTQRVIFRFNGLGSALTQSFPYDEIVDVRPVRRLFISYLEVKTKKRDFLVHIADAERWAGRILEMRQKTGITPEPPSGRKKASPEGKKRELLDMLTVLRNCTLLNEEEFEEKVGRLKEMKL